ncbi:hypothetical protein ACIA03_30225, partial [Nocardioides sp. NPDC051685]|uniref:hypothetical protein n=1 Tax=Nocardioides sp. NPDC051685 TaxID=3364334 RepID=UPI0037BB2A19
SGSDKVCEAEPAEGSGAGKETRERRIAKAKDNLVGFSTKNKAKRISSHRTGWERMFRNLPVCV